MPRISTETIERVASANDIVEVIQSYIPLKKAGSAYKALCPFHQEKSPSFTVNPQRQSFHCFGCGKGGSVFRFVMDYENLGFADCVRRLAERAGVPILEEAFSAEEDQRHALRKRLLALHAATADWFHRNLLKSRQAGAAREYLKTRGISADVAKRWKLGYAPDAWEAFAQWAASEKFTRSEVAQSGLVTQKEDGGFYDRFRDRLMFPINNDRGEVIAFSGRVLSGDVPGGKYVNSPETPLFNKGSILFGLDRSMRAIHDAETAVVCEGQLDIISAFEAGITNVIAPQGTAFTTKQAQLLHRHAPSVILCYDADSAGQKAAERTFEALFTEGLIVRVAEMPPGQDPDSLIRGSGAEAFRALLDEAKDYFDYLIDQRSRTHDLASHQGRIAFATALAGPVALVGDAFLRDSIIAKVTDRLQLDRNHFQGLVAKSMGRQRPFRNFDEEPRTAISPEESVEQEALPRPGLAVAYLSVAALHDASSMDFLREQEWNTLLPAVADSHILQVVLKGDFNPARVESVNAFLSSLQAREEALLLNLAQEAVPITAAGVRDCWQALRRGAIEGRCDALATQLRKPGLPLEQALRINKEILDLHKQLHDIARLH